MGRRTRSLATKQKSGKRLNNTHPKLSLRHGPALRFKLIHGFVINKKLHTQEKCKVKSKCATIVFFFNLFIVKRKYKLREYKKN